MTPDSGASAAKNKPDVRTSSAGLIAVGLVSFCLLFFAGGAWAYFTKLSGAVVASGQVVVQGKAKVVQHLDGGIVAELLVDNGSEVAAGDVLIRLDDNLLSANLKIYENRLQEAVSLRDRLVAERDGGQEIDWDGELLTLLSLKADQQSRDAQTRLMVARRSSRDGQIDKLGEQVKQLENQLEGIDSQSVSKRAQLGFIEEELAGVRDLKQKGLASTNRLMSLERQREDINGAIASYRSDTARIRNAISETEVQMLQIDREFREQVLTELRQLEQSINELVQQYQATQEKLSRVEIRAPVSGIVHELSIFTIGGVIAPGSPILQIIPETGGFELEANIEPQFIDELFPGQHAAVRFSAFSQRTMSDLDAAIRNISPDVIVDERTGVSFYKVWLSVGEEELAKLHGERLVAGMPVEVFIRTQERTPLSYLLKPLKDQIDRAFREQ